MSLVVISILHLLSNQILFAMRINVFAIAFLFAASSVFGQVQPVKKPAPKNETAKPAVVAKPAQPASEKAATESGKEAAPKPGTQKEPVKKPVYPDKQPTKQQASGKSEQKPITPVKPPQSGNQPVTTPKDITGYWLTAQKGTIVQFTKEGDNYNGTIVWLRQPTDKSGKPIKDVNNPDKSKRNNPMVGTQMVFNLKYNAAKNIYEGGRVYQPQTGRSFNCTAKVLNNGKTLEITGTTAALISKTLTWTRTDGIPGKK